MSDKYSVMFATGCHEEDYRYLFRDGRLEQMVMNNNYGFIQRFVFVNNINSRDDILPYLLEAIHKGFITDYIFLDDVRDQVLMYFGYNTSDLRDGYYYMIQNLAALFFCEAQYLLYFTSDAWIPEPTDWIDEGIYFLNTATNAVVVNPLWNQEYDMARKESETETEDYFYGYGFSDQCYLVNRDIFNKPIYNEEHYKSQRYPIYVWNGYERRVDSWMRNHKYKRITLKNAYYIHQNYVPKSYTFTAQLRRVINHFIWPRKI